MSDTTVGFIILGTAMLVVLGVVFVVASRAGRVGPEPKPPRGVHMPSPSFLPVVISVGMALIAGGLAFRGEGQVANPFIIFPGIAVLVLGIIAWVRAANREWREVEHRPHDDGAAH